MVLKSEKAGLFKIKINIGQYFEEDEEAFWIELREPTVDESMKFSSSDDSTVEMMKQLPHMIIDHNFEKEDGKRFSSDKVWKMIAERPLAANDIISEWSKEIPLAKRNKEMSEESQEQSTED